MKIVLGSQSPQRRALLESLVPADQLIIRPPESENEPGFDECETLPEIESQLARIVDIKKNDVLNQLRRNPEFASGYCLVCADTVVVVTDTRNTGKHLVLGKPPVEQWQNVVRSWFANFYSGKCHEVWTRFCVATESDVREMTVKTEVAFCEVDDRWLQWYLTTEESIGKAGGYGIQEHAAVFVDSIKGSLSNVIGLPVFEVGQSLRQLLPTFDDQVRS